MAHVPGHQDRPKDPLARYTGPTTTGPTPSDFRTGLQTVPTEIRRMGLGLLQLPFSREGQQAAGEAIGNRISQVPVLRDVVGAVPTKAVTGVGTILQTAGGQGRFGNVAGKVKQGDYLGAAEDLALGAANVYTSATMLKPAAAIARFAAAGPVGKTLMGAGGAFNVNDLYQSARGILNRGSDEQQQAAQATPQMVGYSQPQAPGYKVTPYGATLAPREGRQVSPSTGLVTEWNPRTRTYEVVGKQAPSTQAPEGIEQYFDPRSGFNYQWNPTSGIYEVAANTSAVEAPTLSATQQLEFDMARRDIKRETERLLSDLAGRAGSARRETGEQVQTIGRETAGSSQDIASALAAAGLDTSPGQFDVALEDIAGRGALATAKARRQLSEVLGSISGQRGRALEAREQELRDIDALQRAAESDLRRQENERLAQLGLGQGRTR